MLYTRFHPFNCKEHMICEKWEIRVHIGNLGILMNCFIWSEVVHGLFYMHVANMFSIVCIQNFHIWVCMLVHLPILFFLEFGVLLNGYNCLKLTTVVSLMDGRDWLYTRCTMYTVGSHVFQITWLYGSMFMYIQKIDHFNAFLYDNYASLSCSLFVMHMYIVFMCL